MSILLKSRRTLACLTLSAFALGALAGCNKAPQPEVPSTPPPMPSTTTPTPSTGSTSGSTSGTASDSSSTTMPSAMPPASAASQ